MILPGGLLCHLGGWRKDTKVKVSKWNGRALLLVLFLTSCGELPGEANLAEAAPAPVPREICTQVGTGLAELKRKGGIEEDGKGEAVIVEQAWLQMSGEARAELARLIAFNLACGPVGPSAEQSVTFRSEYGRILSQQVVDTRVDIGRMLDN